MAARKVGGQCLGIVGVRHGVDAAGLVEVGVVEQRAVHGLEGEDGGYAVAHGKVGHLAHGVEACRAYYQVQFGHVGLVEQPEHVERGVVGVVDLEADTCVGPLERVDGQQHALVELQIHPRVDVDGVGLGAHPRQFALGVEGQHQAHLYLGIGVFVAVGAAGQHSGELAQAYELRLLRGGRGCGLRLGYAQHVALAQSQRVEARIGAADVDYADAVLLRDAEERLALAHLVGQLRLLGGLRLFGYGYYLPYAQRIPVYPGVAFLYLVLQQVVAVAEREQRLALLDAVVDKGVVFGGQHRFGYADDRAHGQRADVERLVGRHYLVGAHAIFDADAVERLAGGYDVGAEVGGLHVARHGYAHLHSGSQARLARRVDGVERGQGHAVALRNRIGRLALFDRVGYVACGRVGQLLCLLRCVAVWYLQGLAFAQAIFQLRVGVDDFLLRDAIVDADAIEPLALGYGMNKIGAAVLGHYLLACR